MFRQCIVQAFRTKLWSLLLLTVSSLYVNEYAGYPLFSMGINGSNNELDYTDYSFIKSIEKIFKIKFPTTTTKQGNSAAHIINMKDDDFNSFHFNISRLWKTKGITNLLSFLYRGLCV